MLRRRARDKMTEYVEKDENGHTAMSAHPATACGPRRRGTLARSRRARSPLPIRLLPRRPGAYDAVGAPCGPRRRESRTRRARPPNKIIATAAPGRTAPSAHPADHGGEGHARGAHALPIRLLPRRPRGVRRRRRTLRTTAERVTHAARTPSQ
jgi:hypothetical protein